MRQLCAITGFFLAAFTFATAHAEVAFHSYRQHYEKFELKLTTPFDVITLNGKLPVNDSPKAWATAEKNGLRAHVKAYPKDNVVFVAVSEGAQTAQVFLLDGQGETFSVINKDVSITGIPASLAEDVSYVLQFVSDQRGTVASAMRWTTHYSQLYPAKHMKQLADDLQLGHQEVTELLKEIPRPAAAAPAEPVAPVVAAPAPAVPHEAPATAPAQEVTAPTIPAPVLAVDELDNPQVFSRPSKVEKKNSKPHVKPAPPAKSRQVDVLPPARPSVESEKTPGASTRIAPPAAKPVRSRNTASPAKTIAPVRTVVPEKATTPVKSPPAAPVAAAPTAKRAQSATPAKPVVPPKSPPPPTKEAAPAKAPPRAKTSAPAPIPLPAARPPVSQPERPAPAVGGLGVDFICNPNPADPASFICKQGSTGREKQLRVR